MIKNYIDKFLSYYYLTRTNKPIGTLLLLWPTLWALWVSASGFPPVRILLVFVAGSFLMRAAGCIINDCVDYKFDICVKRTASRPLPNGDITVKECYTLFIILILTSFLLVLTLNAMTIFLSIIALLLVWIYPLMKRYIYFPQLILGIAFSWPILMAFSAIRQSTPLSCWLMFIANILWVVSYDTQYAIMDRDDDLKVGIKSTAVFFGKYDKLIICILQISTLTLMVIIGYLNSFKKEFYWMVIIAGLLFAYQQKLIINRNYKGCLKAFQNNNYVGLTFFLGLVMNYQL